VLTSAMVQRVEQGENGLVVTVEQKGKDVAREMFEVIEG